MYCFNFVKYFFSFQSFTYKHKQIRYCSLKSYSADIYKEALSRVDFSHHHNFENVNDTYSNFIQKVMGMIDLLAPIKSRQMKQNSQQWFDGEVERLIQLIHKFSCFQIYYQTMPLLFEWSFWISLSKQFKNKK